MGLGQRPSFSWDWGRMGRVWHFGRPQDENLSNIHIRFSSTRVSDDIQLKDHSEMLCIQSYSVVTAGHGRAHVKVLNTSEKCSSGNESQVWTRQRRCKVKNDDTQKCFEQAEEAPKIDAVYYLTSTHSSVSITFMQPKPCWHAPLWRSRCTLELSQSAACRGESAEQNGRPMTWHFQFFKRPLLQWTM